MIKVVEFEVTPNVTALRSGEHLENVQPGTAAD